MSTLINDIKFGFRQLIKNPGFTVFAVLTLAICLGANLTIFSVFDAILLRSLPFPDADRLTILFNTYPKAGLERGVGGTSVANYFDRRQAIQAFESVSIFKETSGIVGEAGSPRRVPMMLISPEFFSTLQTQPVLGRSFSEMELNVGADDVAILTDGFWRSQFNADPQVLGRSFMNDGHEVRVIGVLPLDFRFCPAMRSFSVQPRILRINENPAKGTRI